MITRLKNVPESCLSSVGTPTWRQESYETQSGHARRRAKELRKAGYDVKIGSLGAQITPVGLAKITMVTIRPGTHSDLDNLPELATVFA